VATGTRIFGIIGDPIAQARSPEVFNALFRQRGVDAVMVPLHVGGAELEPVLQGLRGVRNLGGLVITVPHKPAAAALLRRRSERVAISGVANVLRPVADGWDGELFDGEGFALGLAARGFGLTGKNCAVVGAGGAGSAIALALAARRIAALSLWDIDQGRAAALAQRLAPHCAVPITIRPPGTETDLAVNATPLGMRPDDPLPFEVSGLGANVLVADAVMKPPLTRLLIAARERGCATQEGRHMLDHQVEAIWKFFGLP
jgi:shikimate dehydrogenase